jgi:hypothetical protein
VCRRFGVLELCREQSGRGQGVVGEVTDIGYTHVTTNLNTVQYGAFHYTGIETHIFMSMNEKCIKRCANPLHMK